MNRMTVTALSILTCCLVASSSEQANPRISVYGLKPIGVPADLVTGIQEQLESELIAIGTYEVLSRTDINLILSENRFQQSGACDEESCLVETGTVLGVERIVTGTLSRIGVTYNLVLKIINIKSGRLEASVSRRHTGSADQLLDISGPLLRQLLTGSAVAKVDTVTRTVVQTRTDTVTVRDTVTLWKQHQPTTTEVRASQPAVRPTTNAVLTEEQRSRGRRMSVGALALLGAVAAGVLSYQVATR